MSETDIPRLSGYNLSVYTRAVRLALAEKGVGYDYDEVNPFDPAQAAAVRALHPFGRVPVLDHNGFRLYETAALTSYVDEAFDGPRLSADTAEGRARQRQVISIIDAYGYWPLVRQVASHGVLRRMAGEVANRETLVAGMAAAPSVLNALEAVAGDGHVLAPGTLCLAGCHLLPMLEYFVMYGPAAELLDARPALKAWFDRAGRRQAAVTTRPDLSGRDEG